MARAQKKPESSQAGAARQTGTVRKTPKSRRDAAAFAALCLAIGLLAGALGAGIALRIGGGSDGGLNETSVRDVLMANPEILRDAFVALQDREDAAQTEQRKQVLAEAADEIYRSPGDFVAGNPNGDVTLVEFFDYNCSFCKRAMADMDKLLESDPKLRFVLKEFPILSPGSVEAAKISMAALKQAPDKFLEFHRTLLSSRGQIDGARALQVAGDLGLDVERLKSDAEASEVSQTLGEVQKLASLLGVNGTPGYVVGEEIIPGAIGYDGLAEKIAAARATAAQASN